MAEKINDTDHPLLARLAAMDETLLKLLAVVTEQACQINTLRDQLRAQRAENRRLVRDTHERLEIIRCEAEAAHDAAAKAGAASRLAADRQNGHRHHPPQDHHPTIVEGEAAPATVPH